jgi:hypothetical protein
MDLLDGALQRESDRLDDDDLSSGTTAARRSRIFVPTPARTAS